MAHPGVKAPRRILLIRLRSIGDMLLCTPALRALKRAFPESKVDVVSERVPAAVLENNPRVSCVRLFPGRGSPLRSQLAFFRELRRERYDWVVDLLGNPRSAWMTLFTGAPVRVGFAFRMRRLAYTHPVPKNTVRRYQGEVNLFPLRHLGVPDDGLHPELFLTESERERGRAILSELGYAAARDPKALCIGLNASGSWPAKRWPESHWADLADLLSLELGVRPLLLWGPGDEERAARIAKGREERLAVAPRTSLRELAALVGELDLLIGNDGAPQHFAQALGTPSLTLFGPTWGISWTLPGDSRHAFLQHFLDCGPCDRTRCSHPPLAPAGAHTHQECLEALTPRAVLEWVLRWVGETARSETSSPRNP